MNPSAIAAWQAPFWIWCLSGAAIAASICVLWSATSYWSARLLHAERPSHRILLRIAAGAALGAVLGGAGHRVALQAGHCEEQNIVWSQCRFAHVLPDATNPNA
ncbi:MAG TPA: hypothetical protein VJ806_16790 [Luteimonas sp.]|nr:hypothetical protein [Luteimonas sp.]